MKGKPLVGVAPMILSGIYALWRFRNPPGPSPSIPARSSDMQVAEARALLGLGENSSVEDIRAAHRRLFPLMHPDRGGTEPLAKKINAARDVLLRLSDEKEMPGSPDCRQRREKRREGKGWVRKRKLRGGRYHK